MSAAAKLAAFAALLAGAFGAAALAGAAIDPDRSEDEPTMAGGGAHAPAGDAGAEAPHGDARDANPAPAVRGLAVAGDGLRLAVVRPEIARGDSERLAFRILRADGSPLRDFDLAHTKRMHAIVVRRDLTGFQHVHPELAPDGTWSAPLRIDEPGSYRVFADFSRGGEPITLAGDLRVDGDADLRPLPAPAEQAVSDRGDDVRLDAGRVRAGRPATLRFAISRDGHPVHVEPYLGAGGHLVALRDGDLAFLHVHPAGHADEPASGGHDDAIAFETTFPTAGRYRLFLQFRDAGIVRTVAFTLEVRR